jgi:predicted ATPase
MSHLRDIMQKLGRSHAASAVLAQHRSHYRQQLRACEPAMLRYEWTWLHQHLEDLELCRTNPDMLRATGGRQHLELLLAEAHADLEELTAEFQQRGVVPALEPHSVVSGEHAWDVRNKTIRAQWGF